MGEESGHGSGGHGDPKTSSWEGVRLPRRFASRKDYFIQPFFTTVIGSPLRSNGRYPAGENDLPRLTEQDYSREKVSCTLDN
jgi:hypothetical protein